MLLEAVVADLLDVLLRHDPALAGHLAWSWCWRRSRATGARAERQAPGVQERAGIHDPPGHAQARRGRHLKLAFSGGIATFYLDFFDMWDPKSPWADRRVRLAAAHALDRKTLNEAETLGQSRPTGSFVTRNLEFARVIEPLAYDPARARALLAGRATRTASTPATCIHFSRTTRWARPSARTCRPSASAAASARSSGPRSWRSGAPRSCAGCASASPARTATAPPGCPSTCRRTAPTPTTYPWSAPYEELRLKKP
jgi:Bacterial extracellular solute-binding proteins, family 5 Middle